jgi:hypothetical protein
LLKQDAIRCYAFESLQGHEIQKAEHLKEENLRFAMVGNQTCLITNGKTGLHIRMLIQT